MMTATAFFPASWSIEAIDVRLTKGETQQRLETLGMPGNQRVRHLSTREVQIKGMRPGVVDAAVCWVSLYSFHYQVLRVPRISGEASNPETSTRSTQPTIKPGSLTCIQILGFASIYVTI